MNSVIKILLSCTLLCALTNPIFASAIKPSIPTVGSLDLDSYLGLWYEIRRIENDFQDNERIPQSGPCFNTTAEYNLSKKGKLTVKNTCTRLTGSEVAKAKARVVRGSNNTKLKVNFTGIAVLEWLGIGDGDYWVLALGEKNSDNLYSWVLVGEPKLEYGWILSRSPVLEDSAVDAALSVAAAVGYDTTLFKSFRR